MQLILPCLYKSSGMPFCGLVSLAHTYQQRISPIMFHPLHYTAIRQPIIWGQYSGPWVHFQLLPCIVVGWSRQKMEMVTSLRIVCIFLQWSLGPCIDGLSCLYEWYNIRNWFCKRKESGWAWKYLSQCTFQNVHFNQLLNCALCAVGISGTQKTRSGFIPDVAWQPDNSLFSWGFVINVRVTRLTIAGCISYRRRL